MGYFSNGTEGMAYQEEFCDNCANADSDGMCAIWDAHMLYNYSQNQEVEHVLDLLIPRAKNGLGNEECKFFKRKHPDLFEAA